MSENVDLNSLNRADLNAYATEQGVPEPEQYATKAELITVIEGSQSGSESPPPDGGEEAPPEEAPPEEAPPEEGGEPPAESEPLAYEALATEQDAEQPVAIKLPKTGEETAQEGTKLAEANSPQTGGDVPFTEESVTTGKRIWSLDGAHNVNERQEGVHGFERPDLVEHTTERAQTR